MSKNPKSKHTKKHSFIKDDTPTGYWIYGEHAVMAALNNPNRHIQKAYVTAKYLEKIGALLKKRGITVTISTSQELESLLGSFATHQGIAIFVDPLKIEPLEQYVLNQRITCLLVLDQITDPQNLGAIIRSAAAFGCDGIIMSLHHSVPVNGTVAKAAAGALEFVPCFVVTNLQKTFAFLKQQGFWLYGLSGQGKVPLESIEFAKRTVLVIGSEGKGLRRLTQEECDELVCIETHQRFPVLNASVAAALGLYKMFFISERN